MEIIKRNRRILLITAIVILLSPLSILAYMYMNERAGGLADQRISKVWGLNEPIRIPIANSPQGAVQEFRGEFYTSQFIHQEAVDGGMILFTQKRIGKTTVIFRWSIPARTFSDGNGYGVQDIPLMNQLNPSLRCII